MARSIPFPANRWTLHGRAGGGEVAVRSSRRRVRAPGTGTKGMEAQSVAHVLIILFIVLGNVGFLIERRRKHARIGGAA